MLVTTPHKKEQAKPNVRRKPSDSGSDTRRPANGKTNGSGKRSGARRTGGGSSASGGNGSYGRRVKGDGGRFSLPDVKPWKVILGALVLGAFGLLYMNHVFATQQMLEEVQNLEREFNQAQRANDDLRLNYDRMIGPAEIYENAKGLGFINGGPAEKVIGVERDE